MEEERVKRKPTRLHSFDYGTTGAYFVTMCVQDRRKILSDIVCEYSIATDDTRISKSVGDGALDVPHVCLTPIGKIVEKYLLSSDNISEVEISDYVIMPDHIHAIICIKNFSDGTSRAPSPTAANEVLPHIISTFKRFCNKEIGENIFQRSYYDHVIRDKRDFEARKKYIYENPIKWYYEKIYEDE